MNSTLIQPMSDPAVRARIEEIKGMEGFPKPRGTANALIRLTQRARLSFAAEQLIALCDRTAHEWREWGALLELETGPMPLFEETTAMSLPDMTPEAPPGEAPGAALDAPPGAPPGAPPHASPTASLDFSSRAPEIAPRRAAAGVAEPAQMCVLLVGDEARVRGPLRAMLAEPVIA